MLAAQSLKRKLNKVWSHSYPRFSFAGGAGRVLFCRLIVNTLTLQFTLTHNWSYGNNTRMHR